MALLRLTCVTANANDACNCIGYDGPGGPGGPRYSGRAALLMTAPVALRMTVQEVLVTRALAVLAIQEANSSSAVSTIILDLEGETKPGRTKS